MGWVWVMESDTQMGTQMGYTIDRSWIQWDAMASWILREYDEDIQCDVI